MTPDRDTVDGKGENEQQDSKTSTVSPRTPSEHESSDSDNESCSSSNSDSESGELSSSSSSTRSHARASPRPQIRRTFSQSPRHPQRNARFCEPDVDRAYISSEEDEVRRRLDFDREEPVAFRRTSHVPTYHPNPFARGREHVRYRQVSTQDMEFYPPDRRRQLYTPYPYPQRHHSNRGLRRGGPTRYQHSRRRLRGGLWQSSREFAREGDRWWREENLLHLAHVQNPYQIYPQQQYSTNLQWRRNG